MRDVYQEKSYKIPKDTNSCFEIKANGAYLFRYEINRLAGKTSAESQLLLNTNHLLLGEVRKHLSQLLLIFYIFFV